MMSPWTTAFPVTGANGPATGANGPATGQDGPATDRGGAATMPYCAACGHWVGMFAGRDGWQHFRIGTASSRDRRPYDAGHDILVAWCAPPAGSVSPAQHEQLLAALDDAIAYREHATATVYATAYRVLRRQLASESSVP
jgi:hypothetical protein